MKFFPSSFNIVDKHIMFMIIIIINITFKGILCGHILGCHDLLFFFNKTYKFHKIMVPKIGMQV